MNVTRRRLLAGLAGAVATVPGCTAFSNGVEDLVVRNDTAAPVTVAVSAVRVSDDEELLAESVDLAPEGDDDGSRATYGELVDGALAEVQIDVADGPAGTGFFEDGSSDASSLWATIERDAVSFSRVTA